MLKGRVALVTGSTSGIGQCIAETLARNGADLVVHGLGDATTNAAFCTRLAQEYGINVMLSSADVRSVDQIESLIDEVMARFGKVDILVNNAGIQHVAPIEQFPVEKWNDILAIHLSASFHTIRLLSTQMKARGWGRIVNMGSAHALIASPFKSAYVAAKHGIAGLGKAVALELAQSGVTVNTICPGYVLTPLVEKQIPDTMKARNLTREQVERDVLLAAQPTKRFVTVQEVADTVLFLCSESACSITGATLSIDGGWTTQ
jgi:3-hydroxybutyrate dehydrogenase